MQRDTFKNTTVKSQQNSKKCLNDPQEDRKNKTETNLKTIITLHVNVLNVSGLKTVKKAEGLTEWIKKYDCIRNSLQVDDVCRLNVKGWKKMYHTNNQKKAE